MRSKLWVKIKCILQKGTHAFIWPTKLLPEFQYFSKYSPKHDIGSGVTSRPSSGIPATNWADFRMSSRYHTDAANLSPWTTIQPIHIYSHQKQHMIQDKQTPAQPSYCNWQPQPCFTQITKTYQNDIYATHRQNHTITALHLTFNIKNQDSNTRFKTTLWTPSQNMLQSHTLTLLHIKPMPTHIMPVRRTISITSSVHACLLKTMLLIGWDRQLSAVCHFCTVFPAETSRVRGSAWHEVKIQPIGPTRMD